MKVTNAMRKSIVARNRLALQGRSSRERKLKSERTKAIKSALKSVKGMNFTNALITIQANLKEDYLQGFISELYWTVGQRVGNDAVKKFSALAGVKESPIWESDLNNFISQNVGTRIVSMQNTLRNEVVGWLNDAMLAASEMGVEEVTTAIMDDVLLQWDNVKTWQVRRIVQTEALAVLGQSQDLAVRSLKIPFDKVWTATFNNTRAQHAAMDGVRVSMDQPFTLPNGDLMMFPSDFSLGASAGNLINCSCGVYNVPI